MYEFERGRTLNAAVAVCAYGGQWETALSLVKMMESR
jgi:pentatricopeptide repeat protein